jgi:hypothetical protein
MKYNGLDVDYFNNIFQSQHHSLKQTKTHKFWFFV